MMRFSEAEAISAIERWFRAAVRAVDPTHAVATSLQREGSTLFVAGQPIEVPGRLFVAAIGKGAVTMAIGAHESLGGLIACGIVITKDGHAGGAQVPSLEIFEASHPIPDERGRVATEVLLTRLADLGAGDVVLVLLSGGGSALLEAPVEGVSMADMAVTTGLLLRAGAPIQHLNAVRVPLSKVKGGGLRRSAPHARFITLVLSDVLGNDTRVIASGPTVPTAFTSAGALHLLADYGITELVPTSVLEALSQETAEHPTSLFEGDIVHFVGDNSLAVEAFAGAAREDGVATRIILENAEGEASALAIKWVSAVDAEDTGIDLFLGGGEATVKVRGDGVGGRNTEFALAAALELERRTCTDWVVASLATDGQDALTGVAGTIASVATLKRARERGIDPLLALQRNDSLAVFRAAGGCVEPGPTGTNVNDIYVALKIQP